MKALAKKLSVKVGEKEKHTENSLEFVRIKRSVSMRISRKIDRGNNQENKDKVKMVDVFKGIVRGQMLRDTISRIRDMSFDRFRTARQQNTEVGNGIEELIEVDLPVEQDNESSSSYLPLQY